MFKPNKPILSEEFLNEIAFEMAQIYGRPDDEENEKQDLSIKNSSDKKSIK